MLKNITRHQDIITLIQNNTTRHLTDSRKIIIFSLLIIILGLTNITSTSAESYESSQGISFTLNPTINISISGGTGPSSSGLTIANLTPGDYKDSNTITVSASSNALSGYNLYTNVGNSTYNYTDLRIDGNGNTNSTSNNVFNTLSATAPTIADIDDSKWGYSYSVDNGTTWINGNIGNTSTGYGGLPLYSDNNDILLANTNTNTTTSLQFKIGARASTNQIAGEYTNTINFIGLANPNPSPIYMQNATLADCGKDMVDSRDNTVYTTALVGDRCWMTKNLDLAGGTQLTSDNTNMPEGYTLPTANGFQINNRLPNSSTEGFNSDTKAFVYNSPSTDCSSATGCYSYYSWTTATLGSGLDITTDNTDAPYSVCPKGWRLPNTRTGIDDTSDSRRLVISAGGSAAIQTYDSTTAPIGTTIFNSLYSPPLSFLRAGYYDDSTFYGGGVHGYYWSSTSYSGAYARDLAFNSTHVNSALISDRKFGFSVRCIKSS